jgi:hypothetical protein
MWIVSTNLVQLVETLHYILYACIRIRISDTLVIHFNGEISDY